MKKIINLVILFLKKLFSSQLRKEQRKDCFLFDDPFDTDKMRRGAAWIDREEDNIDAQGIGFDSNRQSQEEGKP